MRVEADAGRIFDTPIQRATATIEDMRAKPAVLKVAGRTRGSGADGLRYLRESPLVEHFGRYLQGARITSYNVCYTKLLRTVGRWFSESLTTRRSLMDENARLRTEHLLLEAQVQKLEALQVENRRLRELLHAGGKVPSERVLVAELLAVDADPFSHQFIINKGSLV